MGDILVNSDISQLADDQFDSGRDHVCSWVAGRDGCKLPEVQLPERSGKPWKMVPSWCLELVSAPKLCRRDLPLVGTFYRLGQHCQRCSVVWGSQSNLHFLDPSLFQWHSTTGGKGGQQVPQRPVLCGVQGAHLPASPSPTSPLQGSAQSGPVRLLLRVPDLQQAWRGAGRAD